jgi:hypothetical protein
MKTFLAIIGAFHLMAFILGSFGALDYHLCIKAPAGMCKKETT